MKWLPTLLVLAVFSVLLWVSSLNADLRIGAASAQGMVAAPVTDPVARHPSGSNPVSGGAPAAADPARARPVVAQRAAAQPGSLSGRVVSPDGAGLIADVVLKDSRGIEQGRARSGQDGSFAFRDLAGGRYTVSAHDSGGFYTHVPSKDVQLGAQGTTGVDLEMRRGLGTLTGTVVDSTGAPVEDEFVLIRGAGTEARLRVRSGGTFRMAGLVDDTYAVMVEGFEDSSTSVTLAEGASGEAALAIMRPAELNIFLTANERKLEEAAAVVVKPMNASLGSAQTHDVVRDSETGNISARFTGLAPGAYQVNVVHTNGFEMLQGTDIPTYELLEGGQHTWTVSLMGATPQANLPLVNSILMVFVIGGVIAFVALVGATVVLPGMLFLSPRRPPGLPVPAAASEEPAPSEA